MSRDMPNSSLCHLYRGIVRVIQLDILSNPSAIKSVIALVSTSRVQKGTEKRLPVFSISGRRFLYLQQEPAVFVVWAQPALPTKPNVCLHLGGRERKCRLRVNYSRHFHGWWETYPETLLTGLLTPRPGANFRAHWSLMSQSFRRELESI